MSRARWYCLVLLCCAAGCGFRRVDTSTDMATVDDLTGADLAGADLAGADLAGADLAGADLSRAAKRLFVTRDAYSGSMNAAQGGSSGVLGGDLICTNTANAAHIGGIWRAWLSDGTNDAIDRIVGNGPWRRMDGALAFADHAALASGPIVPINLDQLGARVQLNSAVWTGTLATGKLGSETTPGHGTCDDWSNNTSGASGHSGDTESTSGAWTDIESHPCSYPARLYCFEQ